jgi:hypothetical protein
MLEGPSDPAWNLNTTHPLLYPPQPSRVVEQRSGVSAKCEGCRFFDGLIGTMLVYSLSL